MRSERQGKALRLVIVLGQFMGMPQPLLLAICGLTLGVQQTPAETQAQPFTDRQEIADTVRLALTPKIDGVIEDEEWDPLLDAEGVHSYFQWEPRKLHLAGKLPAGKELVYSIDLRNNGWLVGRDNLEIRLRQTDGAVSIKGRVLDADYKAGPRWVDVPGLVASAKTSGSVSEDGTWTVETTVTDPGTGYFSDESKTVGLRVDAVKEGAEAAPYIPRMLRPVRLGMKRATGLPGGVFWEPEGEGRYVVPGRGLKIRYTFKGDNNNPFHRVAMRSEGFARQETNIMEVPFPRFDRKNRAFVDYDTGVIKEASNGWRLARCVITSKDGATAVGQASYRIAPVLDIDLVREDIHRSASTNMRKVTVYLRANSGAKMEGKLKMILPEGFSVLSGNENPFVLYGMGTTRRVFQISIPGGAVGTFPVNLEAKIGNRVVTETSYLTIQY